MSEHTFIEAQDLEVGSRIRTCTDHAWSVVDEVEPFGDDRTLVNLVDCDESTIFGNEERVLHQAPIKVIGFCKNCYSDLTGHSQDCCYDQDFVGVTS